MNILDDVVTLHCTAPGILSAITPQAELDWFSVDVYPNEASVAGYINMMHAWVCSHQTTRLHIITNNQTNYPLHLHPHLHCTHLHPHLYWCVSVRL